MIKPFIKFRSRSNENIAYAILDATGFVLPQRGSVVTFPMSGGVVKGKIEDVEHEFDKENNQIVTIWIEEI